MKKIGLFTLATAFAALIIGSNGSMANAAAYTVEHVDTGADGTLNYNGSTFSFTDPDDIITGFGAGELVFGGNYDSATGAASDIYATINTSGGVEDLITDGSGIFSAGGPFALGASITGSNGNTLSYSTTSAVEAFPGTYYFTSGGGSYTTPAPEASSVIALSSMLLAGGLLLFAAKRKKASTIA